MPATPALHARRRALLYSTPGRPRPAICGSIDMADGSSRISSRIRWSAACAPRTWWSRISSTIPAKTASGRSRPSSMCRTTSRTNGRAPRHRLRARRPAAQTMNGFNRFIQYMVNQGYLVIAPNYRGSTGYGKEFQQANLFDMGGGDLAGRARRRRLDQADRLRRSRRN